jgi:hypothetical protein
MNVQNIQEGKIAGSILFEPQSLTSYDGLTRASADFVTLEVLRYIPTPHIYDFDQS